MPLNPVIEKVTRRIIDRSRDSRERYLDKIAAARREGPHRGSLSCGNLAHAFAASENPVKKALGAARRPNIALVSAYNDMLSAHQPLQHFPAIIKMAAWEAGGVAQFAGGVPAMCDGVTQGQPGMQLSLFSRDVIAMATAIALSHNMFDGAICLGVCDKIVPGMLIGALSFGHLPFVFVPAGPMQTGLPNREKARIRQQYATGEIGRDELLKAESKSYHSAGTCTFYGTANSNQLLMEIMGLHLPGSTFVNPGTDLRKALTRESARRAVQITELGEEYTPIADVIDERSIVNGIVGLLASGGSTNHTLHLVAIAAAAGISIDWDDFSELSDAVPLLARVYPNGSADINHFNAAGGIPFLVRELLSSGFLHEDVNTIAGQGLARYRNEPFLEEEKLVWREGARKSVDKNVLVPVSKAFSATGGLKIMNGNLGRGICKVSALDEAHVSVSAPARVFDSQEDVQTAFQDGELDRDVVVVVRYQGVKANGMPELHKLTPALGVLMDRGFNVALVTDGRMSGASGKALAVIQVTPECAAGGALAKVRDGDVISVDSLSGAFSLQVDSEELANRTAEPYGGQDDSLGMGRELFSVLRDAASAAEQGASVFKKP